MSPDLDHAVRLAAFKFVEEQSGLHDGVLPRGVLAHGFPFDDTRIKLVGPQGIFKPKILQMPISITTVVGGPYDDGFSKDGRTLYYRFRGQDPQHPDNVGLRMAMERQRPLIYFHGIVPGSYCAAWPVFVIAEERLDLRFRVEVDQPGTAFEQETSPQYAETRRAYITVETRHRLHQRAFRERVLAAYQRACAVCSLRRTELLDASHILPDADPRGEPVVSNGIALCKLHHAAFDRNFLTVTPTYEVIVRPDILHERDGPMLVHGLQELHGSRIVLPRRRDDWPNRDFLQTRLDFIVAMWR